MTWRWRRVIGRGPFRITLSKKGVGYSVGIPGLRFGRSPTGRDYASQSVPGTGLYRIKYLKKTSERDGSAPPASESGPAGQPTSGDQAAPTATALTATASASSEDNRRWWKRL